MIIEHEWDDIYEAQMERRALIAFAARRGWYISEDIGTGYVIEKEWGDLHISYSGVYDFLAVWVGLALAA